MLTRPSREILDLIDAQRALLADHQTALDALAPELERLAARVAEERAAYDAATQAWAAAATAKHAARLASPGSPLDSLSPAAVTAANQRQAVVDATAAEREANERGLSRLTVAYNQAQRTRDHHRRNVRVLAGQLAQLEAELERANRQANARGRSTLERIRAKVTSAT